MEEEGRAIVYAGVAAIFVGFVVGAIVVNSTFQQDTYDCTVKCLMAHSIQFNDKCYCEVK